MAEAVPKIRSIKHDLLKDGNSSPVPDENYLTPVYQIHARRVTHPDDVPFMEYEIGDAPGGLKQREKVLLLVGASGAGKTTLINSWINYIIGVELDDNFRFKLVTEETNVTQAHSQTQNICIYTLHHQEGFTIPFTLTIIDTPGFGDTRGIQRDKLIFGQIHDFFNSDLRIVDHIDAVGFVAKSSDSRLTPSQKYIFDSILHIFGKDIKENILLFLTFCDGGHPEVLTAIKKAEIPYKKCFKFNSSGVFGKSNSYNDNDDSDVGSSDNDDSNDESSDFTESFWKLGKGNIKRFTDALNGMPTKSTLLTKKVLQLRKRVEDYNTVLYEQVHVGLFKLRELKRQLKALKEYEQDMEKHQGFTYESEEDETFEEEVEDDAFTKVWRGLARVIRLFGVDIKVRPKHRIMNKKVKKIRTYEDIKAKYETAADKVMTVQELIMAIYDEFELIEQEIMGLMCEIRDSMKTLKEIALKPDSKSIVDYIDMVIEQTLMSKKPQYENQVEDLRRYRECAVQLMKVASNEYDPFNEFTLTKDESKSTTRAVLSDKVSKIWSAVRPFWDLVSGKSFVVVSGTTDV